ncbi:uncharacterized protein Dmul_03300 [Desulfococcus multivorans]|nr:uncharacterized protein Dmul_03300 [Desulfococcus multivorans]
MRALREIFFRSGRRLSKKILTQSTQKYLPSVFSLQPKPLI